MSKFYELTTPGGIPVSAPEMRTYLKLSSDSDDPLISELLEVATQYGENYTGRDFRVNDWRLLMDAFADRIVLNRDPVESITSVSHLVDGEFVTVTGTTYYLKKDVTESEILLQDGQTWPTDTDTIEHGIQIDFLTTALRKIDLVRIAIKRHVALLYANRGDCPDPGDVQGIQNVNALYNMVRVPRI
jgi:uncharacterized phiE125 gp8 family phage protein